MRATASTRPMRSPARLIRAAGGAVTTQIVTAASSLVLQALAARMLGADGFAQYALTYGTLIFAITLYTSWFGDTLTVLDRFDPRVRITLLHSAVTGAALTAVATAAVGVFVLSPVQVGLATVVAITWVCNESMRRVFTARTEFWRLAVNDSLGAVVTVAVVVVAAASVTGLTVGWFFAALAAGQSAATAIALVRLPANEYRVREIRGGTFSDVASFAGWRAAQAGIRPLALLLSRMVLGAAGGPVAVAAVEAARLLLAPALTVANGAGTFVLSTFARASRDGRPPRSGDAARASAVLAVGVGVLGAGALALSGPLTRLVTGGGFAVDNRAVLGWAVYVVVFAATLPLSTLATTRRLSRLVFRLRAAEMSVGLASLTLIVIIDSDSWWSAPYCLSVGGVLTALMLWASLRRSDPAR